VLPGDPSLTRPTSTASADSETGVAGLQRRSRALVVAVLGCDGEELREGVG
jgi:hypothetical protein